MDPNKEDIAFTSKTDEELLAAYQAAGDLAVLGLLYKRYMGLVYTICLKYLKTAPESEDAVMDIFEHIVQKASIHEIGYFKGWLAAVARNHCLMQLRKQKGISELSFEDSFMQSSESLHQGGEGVDRIFALGQDYEQKEQVLTSMERCIETLVEQQKRSIQLFYLEQKCYKEVAERTGYPIDKVRSYIQNGRRNLKICMEKEEIE